MFKRFGVKNLAWVGIPLVLLLIWFIFWLIGRIAGPHVFHLVAHYSAKDTPTTPVPQNEIMSEPVRQQYEQYLAEGRPAVFTESGLFLYEKGGDLLHTEQEEAVIALHDWAGRRLWAVTLPACTWRQFSASPDGKYLVTSTYGRGSELIEVWQDGKLAWDFTPTQISGLGSTQINNDGRLFIWSGDKVLVVEEGEVIASNDHLPLEVWTPTMLAKYRVCQDGSAMAGVLHPRALTPGDNYFHDTAKPRLEYLALTIRNRKVVPVRKFTIPNVTADWQLLSDGSVLFADGTRYAPDGKKDGGQGWETSPNDISFMLHLNFSNNSAFESTHDLWPGTVVLQRQSNAQGNNYRIYLPHSGQSVPIATKLVQGAPLLGTQPSDDGRHLLRIIDVNDYAASPVGKIGRVLGNKHMLSAAQKRKLKESIRFELYDPSGKLQASLSGRLSEKNTPCIAAAGHLYIPMNATISPDGRYLVVLGQNVYGNERDYLHFAW